MSIAGRYTDVVLNSKERPLHHEEQPVEYLEGDVLRGRVSPAYVASGLLLGLLLMIWSPAFGVGFGLGVSSSASPSAGGSRVVSAGSLQR